MSNSMYNFNITGNSNALSSFISQSLGGRANQGSLAGLTSVLGDYSSIKSGSYGKLMKAYYQKDKVSANASSTNKTEKPEKTDKTSDSLTSAAAQGASIQGSVTTSKKADKTSAEAATKLVDSVTALDKLSYKEENRDKIADAVSAFVNDYNSTLKSAADSNLINVRQNADWMASGTKTNAKLLASVGVTINEDNTLSLDKEKLASANMASVKSVFDGKDSYAHSIANRASKIYAEAASAGTATASYSAKADYTNVTTGTMLDSLM